MCHPITLVIIIPLKNGFLSPILHTISLSLSHSLPALWLFLFSYSCRFLFRPLRMSRPSLRFLMRFHGTYAYISCISLWFSGSFAFGAAIMGQHIWYQLFLSFSLFYECPFGKKVYCVCAPHRTIVSFLYFKGFYCILPRSIEGG